MTIIKSSLDHGIRREVVRWLEDHWKYLQGVFLTPAVYQDYHQTSKEILTTHKISVISNINSVGN